MKTKNGARARRTRSVHGQDRGTNELANGGGGERGEGNARNRVSQIAAFLPVNPIFHCFRRQPVCLHCISISAYLVSRSDSLASERAASRQFLIENLAGDLSLPIN